MINRLVATSWASVKQLVRKTEAVHNLIPCSKKNKRVHLNVFLLKYVWNYYYKLILTFVCSWLARARSWNGSFNWNQCWIKSFVIQNSRINANLSETLVKTQANLPLDWPSIADWAYASRFAVEVRFQIRDHLDFWKIEKWVRLALFDVFGEFSENSMVLTVTR